MPRQGADQKIERCSSVVLIQFLMMKMSFEQSFDLGMEFLLNNLTLFQCFFLCLSVAFPFERVVKFLLFSFEISYVFFIKLVLCCSFASFFGASSLFTFCLSRRRQKNGFVQTLKSRLTLREMCPQLGHY